MIGRQRFHCPSCGLLFSGRLAQDGRIYAYDRAPDAGHEPRMDALCQECQSKALEPDTLEPAVKHEPTQAELLASIGRIFEALTAKSIVLDPASAFLLLVIGCGTLHAYGESDEKIASAYKTAQDSAAELWDYLSRAAKGEHPQ